MLKGKAKLVAEANGGDAEAAQRELRDNPRVNAKIDDWIKQNPKHWDYIQTLPVERLQRAVVLGYVQKEERNQKMDAGILRKLNENPELKAHYEALVKDVPEDRREQALVSVARVGMRLTSPRTQNQRPPQSQGVRVAA